MSELKCLYKNIKCENKKFKLSEMPRCNGCKNLPDLNIIYGNDTLEYDLLRSISQFRRREEAKIETNKKPEWLKKVLKENDGLWTGATIPGADHTKFIEIDNKIVFITQPYHMNMETFKKLIEFCEERNLEFEVDGESSHMAGKCFRVTITEKEE